MPAALTTVSSSAVCDGKKLCGFLWPQQEEDDLLDVMTSRLHRRRFVWVCYLAGGFWSTVTAAVSCVALLLFVLNLLLVYKRKIFLRPLW